MAGSSDLRTKLMQKRSLRAARRGMRKAGPMAVVKEIAAVIRATTLLAYVRLPLAVGKSLVADSALEGASNPARALEIIGSTLLEYINELGPIYGKAGQIALSRLDPQRQELAAMLQLDRLYGQWPALGLDEVMGILDREVPGWRKNLKRIDPVPLGVASISQAHAAVGHDGREWVIKVIKPDAQKRLSMTVDAIEQVLAVVEPLTVTRAARKAVDETRELCASYRGELSLRRELDTIQRVRTAMNDGRKQQLLRVPQVLEECSSDQVLVVERFRGVLLSEVISGRATIEPGRRALLARKVLQDLLVQVFELGLFHADPHAGNLILVDDGTVGLFDWGLSGELLPSDRKHIAAVLRALISMDFDGLVDALAGIAEDAGREVDRKQIAKELRGFASSLKKKKKPAGSKAPSADEAPQKPQPLPQLLDQCLRAADRLGIPVPNGLLMMAKTLVTIEGLARGIDPDIKLAYAATPVLLRVARPGIGEILKLAGKLPGLWRQFAKVILVGAGLAAFSPALSWILTPAAHAATGIIGDGIANGNATHPAVAYDPRQIWRIMSGKLPFAAVAADIPSAAEWGISQGGLAPPRALPPAPAEFRGLSVDVVGALLQAGSNLFFATPQYSWGYLLARKAGESPSGVWMSVENGARAKDAPALAWRLVNEAGSSGNDPLRRVWMMSGNYDVCAGSFEAMTSPDEFRASIRDALRVFVRHQATRDSALEVFVLQPLPMVQLIANDAVLGKKVVAFGEETTCRDLQERMFQPKKPMDLSGVTDAAEARQVALVSQFLPPNPALMCPTLFARIPDSVDRPARIGNRLRALRDAMAEAVNDARKEASRAGLDDRLSIKLVDATGSVQWTAGDIAADCFHLSGTGHVSLARAIDAAAKPSF